MLDPNFEHLLRGIYIDARTIAVVGATTNEDKAGFFIPRYLQAQGYRIIPVNPAYDEVLGERAYRSLGDIDVPIDVVDVFRPSAEAPSIAKDAVLVGAKVLWLQQGVVNDDAAVIASEAGITVIMDSCIMVEHKSTKLGL